MNYSQLYLIGLMIRIDIWIPHIFPDYFFWPPSTENLPIIYLLISNHWSRYILIAEYVSLSICMFGCVSVLLFWQVLHSYGQFYLSSFNYVHKNNSLKSMNVHELRDINDKVIVCSTHRLSTRGQWSNPALSRRPLPDIQTSSTS